MNPLVRFLLWLVWRNREALVERLRARIEKRLHELAMREGSVMRRAEELEKEAKLTAEQRDAARALFAVLTHQGARL